LEVTGKEDKVCGHLQSLGEMKNSSRIVILNSEGKRSVWRPRQDGGSNFKISDKVVVCEDVDRICLARRRNQWQGPVNTIKNSQVP